MSSGQRMRRTKIVATLGPATDDPAMIERLIAVGVDCFRLNFSHGSQDDHLLRIRNVRAAQEVSGRPIALLADLQGPKLRVGKLAEPLRVESGSDVTLAGRGDAAPGDLELGFPIDLAAQLRRGAEVLIDDGLVRLRVVDTEQRRVKCSVEIGGTVSSNKGVNLPRTYLPIPSITDDDRDNLEFAIDHDVDYVALSFVRRAEDVEDLKKLLAARKSRARAIAKIEKAEAIENLEGIVAVSDGLMVARGDLGVEIGAADVPLAQKRIIRLGLESGKPVITATQMLESMIARPEPTRAEASDVANAILDGTGAVMLSGETAVGAVPARGRADDGAHRAGGRAAPVVPRRPLRPDPPGLALHRRRRGPRRVRHRRDAGRGGDHRADGQRRVGARGLQAPPAPPGRGGLARPGRAAAAGPGLGGRADPAGAVRDGRAAVGEGDRGGLPRRPGGPGRPGRHHVGHAA